jgi:hypothetical protein
MGHSRVDIFKRYYISVKVKWDVQSAYLDSWLSSPRVHHPGGWKVQPHA